jgi:hypothetical protein
MKKCERIDPKRLARSAEVFAELRADRFFWTASGRRTSSRKVQCSGAGCRLR